MSPRYTITATIAADEGGSRGFASAPYSKFQQRHEEYKADQWERLECLYRGGSDLLENKKVMAKIFPRHRGEHDLIYNERVECAHYLPFAGEIVANTVMGVFSDPMTVAMEAEAELPEFYAEFVEDTSRPGKKSQCSLGEFVSKMLLMALIKKRAWAQIDLPRVEGVFDSMAEEDKADARRAYLVAMDPENVIDWEVDEDDDLLWAMTRKVTNRRTDPDGDRNSVTEEFTVFDASEFQVFEITYNKDKPPEGKDRVRLVDEGKHTFGRVPLHRLELPHALWAMNKMESASKALLRDLNSLGWAMRQSLHQELYEFLGSEHGGLMTPVGEAQEDGKRAVNQRRGQGHVQVRGGDDSAAYVGPGTEGFDFALKMVLMHRDEMHRVNNQSGVNTDVTASSKQQSAESKREDTASAENLYRETGKFVREFAKDLLQSAAQGRSEELEGVVVGGMAKFNKRTTDGHLENALLVQSMNIESPTMDRALKLDVVKVHLGDILSEEQLKAIEDELTENIVDEKFAADYLAPEAEANIAMMNAKSIGDAGKDEDEDEGTWSEG